MPKISPIAISILVIFLTVCLSASADWSQWKIVELYSNLDGTVQFIEMATTADNQHQLAGKMLTHLADNEEFVFDSDLPSTNTANTSILIATAAFASIPGAVSPDYIMQDGFVLQGGAIRLEGSFIAFILGYCNPEPSFIGECVPLDGVQSMTRSIGHQINDPTNFAGQVGSLNPADANNLYVDFSIQFSGNGAPGAPFQTLAEAIAAANSGATIFIASGSTPETLLITTPLRMESTGGLVRIGAPAARSVRTGFVTRTSPP